MRLGGSAAVLLALSGASCTTAPITGRNQVILISQQEELSMGAQAYKEVLSKEKVLRSGPLVDLVRRVGQKIAAVTGKKFQWEFAVAANPKVVNAFCLPGGKVLVYTGLLRLAATEDELAVVLGHEIAHATLRHGAERVSQNLIVNLGLSAADLFIKTKNKKTKALLLGALGVGAQVGVLLPYSRTHETEADEVGLRYMWEAGYDPDSAPRFWHKMIEQGGERPPTFLSTHPAPEDRLANLRRLAAELKRKPRAHKAG